MARRSIRAQQGDRLPDSYPEGTKYVVESTRRRGYVRRFIEFPDGRRLDLGTRALAPCCSNGRAKPRRDKARLHSQRNAMQPPAPLPR
jgi:hypothetical protein